MDALRAILPAGTLSGAPKIRAMEIIDELEPVKRGIYGGAVGYLAWNGNMDTAIAIRTAVIKDGELHVQAGAGIVADSCRRWSGKRPSTSVAPCSAPSPLPNSPSEESAMLLMLDNYDSFTYNLVQYLGELGAEVKVVRNDEMPVEALEDLAPERIVVSPGPCTPNEAGISLATLERFAGKLPVLGVCLGHQSLGQAFWR